MFTKKPHADIKKSSLKAIDSKKDSQTRLKHLKIFLDNVDINEAKTFFENNFSHIYYVFYDIFLNIESNLKQKAQKSKEDLDNILQLFEKILILLPELIQKKWQCHSISRVMKKLLHPSNSVKIRRDGMRLFLIWYQILGEGAPDDIHLLFVNLVPDLPVRANNISNNSGPSIRPHAFIYGLPYPKDGFDNISFSSYSSEASSTSQFELDQGPIAVFDHGYLLLSQSGEKSTDDPTILYLETLLEFIVSQIMKIEWKEKNIYKQQSCFQFLFEKFKNFYLLHIFPHFNHNASLYKPTLDLPKLRFIHEIYGFELTDSSNMIPGSPHPSHPHHPQFKQHQLVLHDRLILCQVVVIRWVANFTHYAKKGPPDALFSSSAQAIRFQSDTNSGPSRPVSSASDRGHSSQDQSRSDLKASSVMQGSSASTLSASSLLEKESVASMQSNDDHSYTEYMIVRDTLYASRENINFIHQIFYQAFLLPFNHSHSMRRIVECYRDWIHMDLPELPSFMLEPRDSKETSHQTKNITDGSGADSASDSVSVSSGNQDVIPKNWRVRNDPNVNSFQQDHLNTRAGVQNLFQVFITGAANIFLLEVDEDQPHALLEEQVDMCKRVLNVYRYMVMNVRMEHRTWEQLLKVLLQITSLVVKEIPPSKKDSVLGGRLAPALFQTLIVTWIKANLNVVVSSNLWENFLVVLSSLTQWEELIREWAKTMETLTRVLARQVYGLDLNDLPLDRLSEQKQKKQRGRMYPNTVKPDRTNMASGNASNQSSMPNSTTASITGRQKTSNTDGIDSESRNSIFYFPSSRSTKRMEKRFDMGRNSLVESLNYAYNNGILKSNSEGNLALKKMRSSSQRSTRESSVVTNSSSCVVEGIPPALEREVERMISNAERYVRENDSPVARVRPFLVKRKSRSCESLSLSKDFDTPPVSSNFTWGTDSPGRSPSPAPSTGVDSNSFKESPLHLDALANSDNSCCNSDVGIEQCSVMAGGSIHGWLPDVAVVLWRRMLSALGNINKITNPDIHYQVMKYLTDLFETMLKLRNNLGVTADNQSTPPAPELVPPVTLIIPWLFQALNLDNSYEKGKLYAYRLLCTLTVRRHDLPLPRSHITEFYKFLHHGLVGHNQDVINTLVKYCGTSFFSSNLPGATLLILDFIFAANTIASSSELTDYPRTEAMSILGSLLCFPKHYSEIPVFQPNIAEPKVMTCNDAKEHLVSILLKSSKQEPAGLARCIAISSLGIYIYEELTHRTFHGRINEALAVLLTALRFNNRAIAQVASDMLLLLKDHADVLLEKYPDIPNKIIEELSSTLLLLLPSNDSLPCNTDRKLIVSLMFCIGEWCMCVPLNVLRKSKQSTLETVFKVLNIAAAGKKPSKNKESQTAEDFSAPQDFDPDIKIDNLKEKGSKSGIDYGNSSNQGSPMSFTSNNFSFETKSENKLVQLAARTVLYHLINHLSQFPMGIGASRLNSMINENDDWLGGENNNDELSSDIFNSSNVQLFILNNDTLISFIELPEQDANCNSNGLISASSQVRLIIRTLSGKFTWDSMLLYGVANQLTSSWVKPSSNNITAVKNSTNSAFKVVSPNNATRRRPVDKIPYAGDSTEDVDNLDDLLQYIGHTSPECLLIPGRNLNVPFQPPCDFNPVVEEDTIDQVLDQRNLELNYITKHDFDASISSKPACPSVNENVLAPFQHCRLLLMELGLISWDKRSQFDLLKKNEKLLREFKNLDNQNCRETHKVAVIYVAEGQEDKNSVLKNCGGSQAYEEFVSGLAWEVELETHAGFMGGLQRNKSTGDTAPYYATSFLEVVFHIATRMPSSNEDSLTKKLRHLGNDEIHIVWSEHSREYRRGIIATEFCDVLIVIYPLPNNLFKIKISRKPEVPYFGPLFDGAIVDYKILPGLVRATALNASRAKRSLIPLFQNFYEERARSLEIIRKNHKDPKTFEDFSSCLYDPFCGRTDRSSTAGSNVSFSNLTSALIDSCAKNSPNIPLRQRPMSLSSAEKVAFLQGDESPAATRSVSYNSPNL